MGGSSRGSEVAEQCECQDPNGRLILNFDSFIGQENNHFHNIGVELKDGETLYTKEDESKIADKWSNCLS